MRLFPNFMGRCRRGFFRKPGGKIRRGHGAPAETAAIRRFSCEEAKTVHGGQAESAFAKCRQMCRAADGMDREGLR